MVANSWAQKLGVQLSIMTETPYQTTCPRTRLRHAQIATDRPATVR
jgi:hypothetical protein